MEDLSRKSLTEKYILAFDAIKKGPTHMGPTSSLPLFPKVNACLWYSFAGDEGPWMGVAFPWRGHIIWGSCGSLDRKMGMRRWERELLPFSGWALLGLDFGYLDIIEDVPR